MPVARFLVLQDPATLFDGFKPTGERYTLAARVSGNVGTAFPGGLPQGVTLPPGTPLLSHSVKPLETGHRGRYRCAVGLPVGCIRRNWRASGSLNPLPTTATWWPTYSTTWPAAMT